LGAFTITHTSDIASVAEETVFVRGVGKEDTALTITWNGIDGIDGVTNPTPPHVEPTSGVEPSKLLLSSDKSLVISLAMRGGNGGDDGADSCRASPSYRLRRDADESAGDGGAVQPPVIGSVKDTAESAGDAAPRGAALGKHRWSRSSAPP
jgi:hypothetical protein